MRINNNIQTSIEYRGCLLFKRFYTAGSAWLSQGLGTKVLAWNKENRNRVRRLYAKDERIMGTWGQISMKQGCRNKGWNKGDRDGWRCVGDVTGINGLGDRWKTSQALCLVTHAYTSQTKKNTYKKNIGILLNVIFRDTYYCHSKRISNGSLTKSVLHHLLSAMPSPSSSLFYFCHISDTPPFVPVPLVSSFIPASLLHWYLSPCHHDPLILRI